jgi:ADP-ribose pyrophosphatase YjhB (NUDIX family)
MGIICFNQNFIIAIGETLMTDLASFLAQQLPLTEETVTWQSIQMQFRVTSYLSHELPPLDYITSVRGVILRGDQVLAVRDPETVHILPGGRREQGETLIQTLERELLEETGWTIHLPSLLGFKHFHHLTPKPANYLYPYADFLQLVYTAQANTYVPGARRTDDYELDAFSYPIADIAALHLTQGELAYFAAAQAATSGYEVS